MFVKIDCCDGIKYVNCDLIEQISFAGYSNLFVNMIYSRYEFYFTSPDKRYKELQKLLGE